MTKEKKPTAVHCNLDTRALRANDAARPTLERVSATATLDGVLFELCARQHYRNGTDQLLEVVYTFPLPPQAVLLGFAVEVAGGPRLQGQVLPKREASAGYEAAMAEGDLPVMLQRAADGLCTANIGNLKPGESLVVEVRYAELLRFDQGRLRLAIPTSVAPRFGDAVRDGALQPQQEPGVSLAVEYPFELTLDVRGALAAAELACPTHAMAVQPVAGGVRMALRGAVFLDRDVVITLVPQSAVLSVGVAGVDAYAGGSAAVALAVFQPTLSLPQRASVALKVLVDCSGSMNGDSIESARRALGRVAQQLRPADSFSYSRFGSTGEHHFAQMHAATPAAVRALRGHILQTEADLGGTEMEDALRQCLALPAASVESPAADVLLITDGEIWGVDGMLAAARTSSQRIFTIGVGSAPNAALLTQLAQETGGACEVATPGESLEGAIDRVFQRIRQQPVKALRVDWGGEQLWQSTMPRSLFAGDSLALWALFADALPARARLLADLPDGTRDAEIGSVLLQPLANPDALARMSAAARLAAKPDLAEADAQALAVRYQLLTEHTHCLVVHERAEADKAEGFAELVPVPQMLAAGWGGVGSLQFSTQAPQFVASIRQRARADVVRAIELPTHLDDMRFSLACFEETVLHYGLASETLLAAVEQWGERGRVEPLRRAMECLLDMPSQLNALWEALVLDDGLAEDAAWAAIALAVAQTREVGSMSSETFTELRALAGQVEAEVLARIKAVVDRLFAAESTTT